MPDASPDPTSDTPPKKPRFRLRYSLRSLLIFMLLFSASLALREGWSRPRWQVEHVLRDHWYTFYLVRSAAFSPDGRRIVTASNDGTARVWRRVGTELRWGVFWLPQFWFTVLFAVGFVWSLRRDYKRLMKAPPAATAP